MSRSQTEVELREANDRQRALTFGRTSETTSAATEPEAYECLRDVGLSEVDAARAARGLERGTYTSLREAAAMASADRSSSMVLEAEGGPKTLIGGTDEAA